MIKKWMVIGVFIALIIYLIPHMIPLIIAFVTALLLEPFVKYLQRKLNFKRIYAVTLSFLTFLLVLAAASYFILLTIIEQGIVFIQQLPQLVSNMDTSRINSLLKKWENYSETLPHEFIASIENTFLSMRQSLIDIAQSGAEGLLNLVSSIPDFLFQFIVYLIAVFLFSAELPSIITKTSQLFHERTKEKITIVFNQLNRVLVGFLIAQLILSGVTFFLALSGLLILKVKYSVVISLIIVLVDLLPILGTGSFLVPWAVYSILDGDQRLGIGLIILFVLITIVRRTIEPKIFSSSMGISALSALISMYLGFKLLGFIGLLAGPGVVILYDALVKAELIRLPFAKNESKNENTA